MMHCASRLCMLWLAPAGVNASSDGAGWRVRFIDAPNRMLRISNSSLSSFQWDGVALGSRVPVGALVYIENMAHVELIDSSFVQVTASNGIGTIVVDAGEVTRSVVVERLACKSLMLDLVTNSSVGPEAASCLSVYAPSHAANTSLAIIASSFINSTRPIAAAGFLAVVLIARSSFTYNKFSRSGGALAVRLPSDEQDPRAMAQPLLRMECTTFSGNTLVFKDPDANRGVACPSEVRMFGGAVAVFGGSMFHGRMELLGCTFFDNRAMDGGGGGVGFAGIIAPQASIEVCGCTAQENEAMQGGWLMVGGEVRGNFTMQDSIMLLNRANHGGAMSMPVARSGAHVLFGRGSLFMDNNAESQFGWGGGSVLLCDPRPTDGNELETKATYIGFVGCQFKPYYSWRLTTDNAVFVESAGESTLLEVQDVDISGFRVLGEDGLSDGEGGLLLLNRLYGRMRILDTALSGAIGNAIKVGAMGEGANLLLQNVSVTEYDGYGTLGALLQVDSMETATITVLDSHVTGVGCGDQNLYMLYCASIFQIGSMSFADVLVARSSFVSNIGAFGTVMRVGDAMDSNITLLASYFANNTANNGGGIIFVEDDAFELSIILDSCVADGNRALGALGDSGGGLVHVQTLSRGALVLRNTTVRNNSAPRGAVVVVGTLGPVASVRLDNSMFLNNTAVGSRGIGGIFAGTVRGAVIVQGSTLRGNTAGSLVGAGGGMLQVALEGLGRVEVLDSLVEGNSAAADGGAVSISTSATSLAGEHVLIRNSTFTGNAAKANGGALAWFPASAPGAPFNLTVQDSAFTGNIARNAGGALYLAEAVNSVIMLQLVSSTFQGNRVQLVCDGCGGGVLRVERLSSAGVVRLANSTLVGNAAGIGGGLNIASLQGTVEVTGSTMLNNTALGVGGALSVEVLTGPGQVILDAARFEGNAAQADGGAGEATVLWWQFCTGQLWRRS